MPCQDFYIIDWPMTANFAVMVRRGMMCKNVVLALLKVFKAENTCNTKEIFLVKIQHR